MQRSPTGGRARAGSDYTYQRNSIGKLEIEQEKQFVGGENPFELKRAREQTQQKLEEAYN
jgi:hypothetical protein